jgi:CRP-like cAMP-binding protein
MDTVTKALHNDPIPNVAVEPKPQCLFWGYKDSAAQFMVRYWLSDLGIDDPTDSAVRTRVWFALKRAGIALSIPASSVFLTHETPERDARKADREQAQRLRALDKVDLFRTLANEQRTSLASQLTYVPYGAGEAVTHEGEHDDGLFMILEGEASVRIGKGNDQREVARLKPGEFFGEMSLMTGEVRTATVIAATDLVCYRVSKAAFQAVIEETPGVAELIAEVLMTRKHALEAARDEQESDRKKRMDTARRDLASRIRGFFGLDAAR